MPKVTVLSFGEVAITTALQLQDGNPHITVFSSDCNPPTGRHHIPTTNIKDVQGSITILVSSQECEERGELVSFVIKTLINNNDINYEDDINIIIVEANPGNNIYNTDGLPENIHVGAIPEDFRLNPSVTRIKTYLDPEEFDYYIRDILSPDLSTRKTPKRFLGKASSVIPIFSHLAKEQPKELIIVIEDDPSFVTPYGHVADIASTGINISQAIRTIETLFIVIVNPKKESTLLGNIEMACSKYAIIVTGELKEVEHVRIRNAKIVTENASIDFVNEHLEGVIVPIEQKAAETADA